MVKIIIQDKYESWNEMEVNMEGLTPADLFEGDITIVFYHTIDDNSGTVIGVSKVESREDREEESLVRVHRSEINPEIPLSVIYTLIKDDGSYLDLSVDLLNESWSQNPEYIPETI